MKINERNCIKVHVFHRRIIPIVLSAALPWLSACQVGGTGARAVSLEEAKQITAEFKGSSFVAPPRTVTDIMKLLDEHRSTNWGVIKGAQAIADESPPATTDQRVLAEFYLERGQNAVEISRLKQARADLSRALDIITREGIDDPFIHSQILSHLSRASDEITKKIELREKALALPYTTDGQRVGRHFQLAQYLSYAGDLDSAGEHIDSANSYVDLLRRRPLHRAKAFYAEGNLLTRKGEYTAGEQRIRQAIEVYREEMAWGIDTRKARQKGFAHRYLAMNLRLQGRLAEAEVEARKGVGGVVKRFGRYSRIRQ